MDLHRANNSTEKAHIESTVREALMTIQTQHDPGGERQPKVEKTREKLSMTYESKVNKKIYKNEI